MEILSANEIRKWDEFTIVNEPVTSLDLMERAADACVQWLKEKPWKDKRFQIFCGKGHNGGDGLAIARMLLRDNQAVETYVLETGKSGCNNFETNLQRLEQLPSADVHFIQSESDFPPVEKSNLVIDALFGSGLNKPLEGCAAQLVKHINDTAATVVSVDLPSGLATDRSSTGNGVIKASNTLTFQCYKLALLTQENASFIGDVQALDIGLHPGFLKTVGAKDKLVDEAMIRTLFKPRQRFAHKGAYGHVLIIGGSWGKMGAAVLATKACMSSGAGLTTAFIPACGHDVMQGSVPEAMALIDEEEKHLKALPDEVEKFSAIGIGPGMGTHVQTQHLLSFVLKRYNEPLVIDADGLNCLAMNKEWLTALPSCSILTPHPKEFDRLFGEQAGDFERIETAKHKAAELNVIILVKGHHTAIACPDGECYFNSTGNAGMAKGGSGDALTGILTSLLGQQYLPKEAAILGVYIHGRAGDYAAKNYSKEAMLPTHTIDCLADVLWS